MQCVFEIEYMLGKKVLPVIKLLFWGLMPGAGWAFLGRSNWRSIYFGYLFHEKRQKYWFLLKNQACFAAVFILRC